MAPTDDAFGAAITQTEANKGKSSDALRAASRGGAATASAAAAIEPPPRSTEREIKNIVFACDAGMGSSAMGASVLRNKIKKAGIEDVTVVNKAIANLDGIGRSGHHAEPAHRPGTAAVAERRSTSRSTTS